MERKTRVEHLEQILRDWLADPEITLICGDWRAGSIMELFPGGRATLSRAKYPEPFDGVRDLKLEGEAHHVHLDLSKLGGALYTVAPSVCYGYRPSFEVRFSLEGDDDRFSFAVSLSRPYSATGADRSSVVRYFQRLIDHHARFPGATRFHCAPEVDTRWSDCWKDATDCLFEASGVPSEALDGPINAVTLQRAFDRLMPLSGQRSDRAAE